MTERRTFFLFNCISALALLAVSLLMPFGLKGAEPGSAGGTPQNRPVKNRAVGQGWSLYGRVLNSQGQPVSGYSVFFEGGSGAYLQQYGLAYTASDGSFQLTYAGNSNQATPALYVTVANNAGTPVYHNSSAFHPVIGKAIYQSITLPRGLVVKKRPVNH